MLDLCNIYRKRIVRGANCLEVGGELSGANCLNATETANLNGLIKQLQKKCNRLRINYQGFIKATQCRLLKPLVLTSSTRHINITLPGLIKQFQKKCNRLGINYQGFIKATQCRLLKPLVLTSSTRHINIPLLSYRI